MVRATAKGATKDKAGAKKQSTAQGLKAADIKAKTAKFGAEAVKLVMKIGQIERIGDAIRKIDEIKGNLASDDWVEQRSKAMRRPKSEVVELYNSVLGVALARFFWLCTRHKIHPLNTLQANSDHQDWDGDAIVSYMQGAKLKWGAAIFKFK